MESREIGEVIIDDDDIKATARALINAMDIGPEDEKLKKQIAASNSMRMECPPVVHDSQNIFNALPIGLVLAGTQSAEAQALVRGNNATVERTLHMEGAGGQQMEATVPAMVVSEPTFTVAPQRAGPRSL